MPELRAKAKILILYFIYIKLSMFVCYLYSIIPQNQVADEGKAWSMFPSNHCGTLCIAFMCHWLCAINDSRGIKHVCKEKTSLNCLHNIQHCSLLTEVVWILTNWGQYFDLRDWYLQQESLSQCFSDSLIFSGQVSFIGIRLVAEDRRKWFSYAGLQ